MAMLCLMMIYHFSFFLIDRDRSIYRVAGLLLLKTLKNIKMANINDTIECPECGGDGKTFYSCCGDDIKGTEYEDVAICPTCREHLGEPETCENCNGLGTIDII